MGVYLEANTWLTSILKSVFHLFPTNVGGMKGIFLLLRNFFRIDQYLLELVEGLDNLANI